MLLATSMPVSQFSDEANPRFGIAVQSDAPEDLQSPELDGQSPELASKPPELSEEDKAERLWWDKCEVMGKIKDCARMIQEVESEVDGYQDQIKEAKEVLKGQQALLARYSSQLADIMDGHPLPRNPNAAAETVNDASADYATAGSGNWRDMPTRDLLDGIKGMGAKKLDAICDLAPTVGKLEELRCDASRAHKLFKEVLPKGCGEAMADEIENRLIEKAKYDEADESDDNE